MESFFQNCVSQFDLNLFEQTTSANQTTSSAQCFLVRKRGISRMKDRMKSISQVITKARKTNAILVDVQKELQDTRKQLEDTKTILFEKNEEHKVICNERNTYFNSASEYSNEIKVLKQQLKLLEEKDFNTKMKDQIIQGYSVQMLSLKTEADKIEHTKKQSEKGSSLAIMRANKGKESLEKKLIKVLNDYVYPTIKKRDKWLQNIMTKYPPKKCDNPDLFEKTVDESFDVPMPPLISKPKEELIEKTQKSAAEIVIADCSNLNEVILDDEELPANSSKLTRDVSVDFDYAGSVDTGRGSSLALSEGEKSFYSPDYYMNNSPPNAASNLCNKCSIIKIDVSTSPIPQKTSNIADITRTESCNRCSLISKRDACTSPMPSKSLDVATNTSDFLNARCTLDNSNVSIASKNKSINDTTASNKIKCTNAVDTPANWTDYEKLASCNNAGSVNLPDNIIITKSDDGADGVNLVGTGISTQTCKDTESNHNLVSSNELLYRELPDNATLNTGELANNDKKPVTDLTPGIDTIKSKITISIEELPSSPTKLEGIITPNCAVYDDHISRTPSPVEDLISTISSDDYDDDLTNDASIFSTELPTTSERLTDSLMLDTQEFNDTNSNRTVSPMEDFSTTPGVNIDYTGTNGICMSNKKLSPIPENACSVSSNNDLIISKNTLKERECLKLNNSNILSNDDVTTDMEIQTILNKMQQRPLLTPIPTTPPRRITNSPIMLNDISTTEVQNMSIAKKIDECLNLVRNNLDEVFAPLHSNLPKSIDQIIGFSNEKEILRHLLRFPIKHNNRCFSLENKQESSCCNATESSNTQHSADNLNTASMWRPMEISNSVVSGPENNDSDDDCATPHMKSELFEQVTSGENNNHKNGSCKIDHKLPGIIENRKIVVISNDQVVESDITVGTGKYVKDKSFNNNDDPHNLNEYMHESISNHIDIGTRNNNQECVMYSTSCMTELNDVDNEINDDTTRRYNNIIYENEVSDDNEMEIFDNSCANNNSSETQQLHVNNSISKMRKLTKLEKLRLKMVPKGKIKYELKNKTKKPRFKPKPIVIVSKKKVTNADSAASLNDKSIYENAIKVINASKTKTKGKVPIILLEDCTTKLKTSPQKIAVSGGSCANKTTESQFPLEAKSGTKNNCVISLQFKSPTSKLPNHQEINKQQPTEAVADKFVSPKRIINSHSSLICEEAPSLSDTNQTIHHNVPQKCKRKRASIMDHQYPDGELEMEQPKLLNIEQSGSASQRRLLRSSYSSDSEPLSNKPSSEVMHSLSANDHMTYESRNTKRMRTSISDCQRPFDNSNANNRIKCPVANKIDTTYTSPSTTTNQVIDRNRCNTTTSPQRILRSSSVKHIKENGLETAPTLVSNANHFPEKLNSKIIIGQKQPLQHNFGSAKIEVPMSKPVCQKDHESAVSYADLCLFSNEHYSQEQNIKKEGSEKNYKENLLCHMIQKYGVCRIKHVAPKIPDSKVNEICDKLDTSISHIIQLPQDECQNGMKALVATILDWNIKHFLLGLIKYLKDPQRKIELFKKVSCPPAPPMTKVEQVLLYVIDDLQNSYNYRDIVQKLLMNIEYILFALNKTPEEMDVIETMSHFYALLCRSYQKISKLRLFIIDAMYCLQYKSIVVIKQCLEVWMFILPLGHMGLAKTPLVACLVYLLHFYKCDDKQNRIQDLRNTLRNKYYYDLTDWNENKILDLFRTAIMEIKDNPLEKKMLRLALLILAKRNGATWCQNHIVNNMVKPIIADKSIPDVPKRFCVSVLGPLLKPYPNNMKVHCEMTTDYLLTMLDQKHSPKMQESIVTSLICLNKNHNNRVIQFLLEWNPNPRHVSPEFESVFKDYVRSKTVKTWKTVLSQI